MPNWYIFRKPSPCAITLALIGETTATPPPSFYRGSNWAWPHKCSGGHNRAATELSFGHVTTNTWAYSGVFCFFRIFCHKICPHPNHFLKIQWEIHFFKRHFLERNAPNFFLEEYLYSTLSENCFRILFQTSGSSATRKHANTHIGVFHMFYGPGTSGGPGSNPKAVSDKGYIITVLNFFWSILYKTNGLPNIGFPIVSSKIPHTGDTNSLNRCG